MLKLRGNKVEKKFSHIFVEKLTIVIYIDPYI